MANTRKPTFDMDQLNDIIAKATAEAVANAMANKQAEIDAAVAAAMAAQKGQDKGKTRDALLKRIEAAFKKAGYQGDIVLFNPELPLASQPNVNCLTYGKWLLECGRKVRRGEKAVKIGGYRVPLFHLQQTEIASPQERRDYFAKRQAAEAKREAASAAQAA
jgi:hypothetical protein